MPFCATDPARYRLLAPWSRGDYSIATNGHVLVRLPRLPDVPENPDAPSIDKIWATISEQTVSPLPKIKFPELKVEDCPECDTSGKRHSCPSCRCECPLCGGKGKIKENADANIRGVTTDMRYAKLVIA